MQSGETGDIVRLPQASFFPLALLRGPVLYLIRLYFHIQLLSLSTFQQQSYHHRGRSIRQPFSLHFPVVMLGFHFGMASAISYTEMPT